MSQTSATVADKEYTGSCHCKRFRFKFTHPAFDQGERDVVSCNCSICSAKGCIWLVGMQNFEANVQFTAGSLDELTLYTFNKMVWKHRFCPTCGCEIVILNGTNNAGGVNVRAVDDVDLDKLKVQNFDGKSW